MNRNQCPLCRREMRHYAVMWKENQRNRELAVLALGTAIAHREICIHNEEDIELQRLQRTVGRWP